MIESFVLLPGVWILALIGDRIFGEPKWHPLVAFGNFASEIESRTNNGTKLNGLGSMVFVVAPVVLVIVWIQWSITQGWAKVLFDAFVLYLVIGWQSMKEHALAVYTPLEQGNLAEARKNLGMIVSRDTGEMDESLVAGSTLESVLENGNDCLFASLFWYALLGPAGAVLHRLVNTLDAMWGYKNEKYLHFGWGAARLDDILGWIPSRLTALSYGLCGSMRHAMQAWKNQIGKHKSPNAGLVMASGAGSLELTIGGPVAYEGTLQEKPWLGVGPRAQARDIKRSLQLIERSALVWVFCSGVILFVINLIVQI